jgi:hypothetical protein
MIESDAEENRNENEGGEIEEEERVEPEENMTEPKNCESDGRSESGDGVEEETEEQDEKMEGKRMGSRRSSTTLKFLMVEQSERLGARNDPSLWRKGATGSCLHPRQRRSLHESEDSVSELEEEDDQDDNEMSAQRLECSNPAHPRRLRVWRRTVWRTEVISTARAVAAYRTLG